MAKKLSKRDAYLQRVYGITEKQYQSLLEKQNGGCAICQRSAEEFPRNLAVDHDHVSKEIRGLLCNYCNHRLVGRHRDPNVLRRIAEYISEGTGWFVPVKKKKKRKRKRKK